ncbi:uncharacterized skeletal organic matrix protein 5-like [Orbicella faveolata]|uniref:uncharacterized skeletal organic matrix protein 5-like n=1 Tax=Orbicella faveolata TaxID=48498 RepID=UPI0009E45152|nr:uncharacterized skeletal organic matrix protein 5-like [Orbicella faveolata]
MMVERESSVSTEVFFAVYCHMGSFGCGDGGWTLVMKIDRHEGRKTEFDFQKTKLPTYWSTPFSKICLGMKIGHQIKFIVINKHANSLYSLIADGQYRTTSLDGNTWNTLISLQASLQYKCNN